MPLCNQFYQIQQNEFWFILQIELKQEAYRPFVLNLKKKLKKYNISVTNVCPGGLNTTTRLCYQNRIVGLIARESPLNPETVAKIIINGMMHNKNVIITGIVNNCFMLLENVLPEFIIDKSTNREVKKI